jgi:hypothetical protein
MTTYHDSDIDAQWGVPSKPKVPYKRCYETHPALKVGDKLIYGGNCGSPIVLDADIYVALQSGMAVRTPYPWEQTEPTIQVQFSIADMGVPSSVKDFKAMITWLCNQLQLDKKIHVGCIGGHGRTGMVLAAVIAQFTGEKDAIQFVRKNYCKKAVESSQQVAFLMKHFGMSHAEGAKEQELPTPKSHQKWGSSSVSSGTTKPLWPSSGASEISKPKSITFASSKRKISAVPSARNIFEKV